MAKLKQSIIKTCIECGTEFEAWYSRRNCCSRACSSKVGARAAKQKHKDIAFGIDNASKARREWLILQSEINALKRIRTRQAKGSSIVKRQCRVCKGVVFGKGAAACVCKRCLDDHGSAAYTAPLRLLNDRSNGRCCDVCGSVFVPSQDRSKYCSIECYKKTDEFKLSRYIQKQRRRCKKRNSPFGYDDIGAVEVFERDGWKCYLCGIATPKRLKGHLTHPQAPQMDHVHPIKRNGPHIWSNVACSCADCNRKKGDTLVTKIGDEWYAIPNPDGACWLVPWKDWKERNNSNNKVMGGAGKF